MTKGFKMKDVEYKKVMAWNPDCMTKHMEWVAIHDGEVIASDYTKTDLIYKVRKMRHGLK